MFSTAIRLVAKVRALFAEQWAGRPGQQFRETVAKTTEGQNVSTIVSEGAKRVAIGLASRDHSAAIEHYAQAEALRIATEIATRTLDDRERQEREKANQEEIRTRMMRSEEMVARLKLFDEFRNRGALPIWDAKGNMQIVKAPPSFDWEAQRAKVVGYEAAPATAAPPAHVVLVPEAGNLTITGNVVAVHKPSIDSPDRSDESE